MKNFAKIPGVQYFNTFYVALEQMLPWFFTFRNLKPSLALWTYRYFEACLESICTCFLYCCHSLNIITLLCLGGFKLFLGEQFSHLPFDGEWKLSKCFVDLIQKGGLLLLFSKLALRSCYCPASLASPFLSSSPH